MQGSILLVFPSLLFKSQEQWLARLPSLLAEPSAAVSAAAHVIQLAIKLDLSGAFLPKILKSTLLEYTGFKESSITFLCISIPWHFLLTAITNAFSAQAPSFYHFNFSHFCILCWRIPERVFCNASMNLGRAGVINS